MEPNEVEHTAKELRDAEDRLVYTVTRQEFVLRGGVVDPEASQKHNATKVREALGFYGDALLAHHLAVERAKREEA